MITKFYLAFIVTLFITMWVSSYRFEKRHWNGGLCPICGEKLKCFDMDSSGARMYKCSNDHNCKGYSTCVSFSKIDKDYEY